MQFSGMQVSLMVLTRIARENFNTHSAVLPMLRELNIAYGVNEALPNDVDEIEKIEDWAWNTVADRAAEELDNNDKVVAYNERGILAMMIAGSLNSVVSIARKGGDFENMTNANAIFFVFKSTFEELQRHNIEFAE